MRERLAWDVDGAERVQLQCVVADLLDDFWAQILAQLLDPRTVTGQDRLVRLRERDGDHRILRVERQWVNLAVLVLVADQVDEGVLLRVVQHVAHERTSYLVVDRQLRQQRPDVQALDHLVEGVRYLGVLHTTDVEVGERKRRGQVYARTTNWVVVVNVLVQPHDEFLLLQILGEDDVLE
ncbi:hypothetical protein D3C85_967640 [compost metagenome]